ncbi:MAG: hypothetical protein Q8Q28_13455 [Pseudomonadota bacterium]|nr:hypothetical protein [Pseudomonadota bacterium]
MGKVSWWNRERTDWKGFADRHVLFQKDTPDYVEEVFKRSVGVACGQGQPDLLAR